MKILCPCGAKFAVDVTPEMAQRPVQFICPSCGLDSSTAVNELIRQELAATPATTVSDAPVAAVPPAVARAEAPAPAPRIHISRSQPASVAPAEVAAGTVAGQTCLKHPGELIEHQCLVCNKPMCSKCMEIFGYVCSPFCKTKAEARKIPIPQYAGQKSVTEARLWRKVGFASAGIVGVLSLFVGAWIWYACVGSHPKPVFTVQFPDGLRSGESEFCGKDELMFRHGLTLSRYDLKAKKEVWARELADKKEIDDAVTTATKSQQDLIAEARKEGWSKIPAMPSPEEMRRGVELSLASALQMYVHGSNVWIASESGKLVRYDFETGNPGKEIPMAPGYHEAARAGEELLFQTRNNSGQRVINHINLVTADTRVETLGESLKPTSVAVAGKKMSAGKTPTAGSPPAGYQPIDASKIAEAAQRASLPGKIALPAVVANAMNQDRLMREINADEIAEYSKALGSGSGLGDSSSLVSSKYGNFEFSVRLIEERIVKRNAMKAPPKKSALNGEVNASQSAEIANELLNEMQRNAGADTVTENESRYLVTVHSTDGKTPDWTGEVVGPPSLIPSKTVTIVAAGSTAAVLDKSNKKLWQASFMHKVRKKSNLFDDESRFGQGPCVEHDGRLYVCDEAMLTAFDLNTGNVFWRLPSVGIAGMLFDDKGMLYVNSTTGSPDDIKFAKQIDVTRKVRNVILKVDPKSGKTLWSTEAGGFIGYVSGKFIYVWSVNDTGEQRGNLYSLAMETPSYVRIKRIDPGNGKILWDYYEPRAPLDVKFSANTIQIVFKNELQVLRYLTF